MFKIFKNLNMELLHSKTKLNEILQNNSVLVESNLKLSQELTKCKESSHNSLSRAQCLAKQMSELRKKTQESI